MKINLLVYAPAFVLLFVLLPMAGRLIAAEIRLTACDHAPLSSQHWSWREINGKKCWYRGKAGKPKDELYWASQSARAPEAEPEQPNKPAPAPAQVVSEALETTGAFDRAWREILSDFVDPYFLAHELLTQKVPAMRGGDH